ncbi:sulfite exporter TauE/SafE family protein [Beggiatoa leptomitoformis]|uniref:Probable membrane transporter protein n=1 Tax=Beggiatoa leptomitoformis TaxID=288004 RepID=A0A2N9YAL1_9GAMM|nr:sulfite exporter TauE/SafE family protein [Beggiatoa leptomitoformis]ALG67115.1 TSUP family transporter [Beggiatoa leptomitoformis]AUI67490.1 TSUP family transporter [Beggiatoa leptomitoformis]
MEIISLLALGVIAGILAGLLGVGGGVVIVPGLMWIFHYYPELPSSHLMHIAVGTSLATIVITSLSSIYAHHKRGAVIWAIVIKLTPGIIVGALIGAFIADTLSSDTLKKIFAVFLLFVSIQLGFGARPAPSHKLPSWLGSSLVGSVIGVVSSLVGIGGGSLTVPFLVWCNISIRNAVASSAACGFPIAVAGAIGFMITGWNTEGLPTGSIGYVYLPIFITIAITSMLFAPLGAKLAHSVPMRALQIFFALFLAVMSVKLLFS